MLAVEEKQPAPLLGRHRDAPRVLPGIRDEEDDLVIRIPGVWKPGFWEHGFFRGTLMFWGDLYPVRGLLVADKWGQHYWGRCKSNEL